MPRLLALAAVAALAAAPTIGRIQGQLVLSPASPVQRAGHPNARPIAGRIQVLDGHGKVVTEIAADEQGRFGADLPPGRYTRDRLRRRAPLTVPAGNCGGAATRLCRPKSPGYRLQSLNWTMQSAAARFLQSLTAASRAASRLPRLAAPISFLPSTPATATHLRAPVRMTT
jgi:hypothetical protein